MKQITKRQLDVLNQLKYGKTNKDIAEALDVSVPDIKMHISSMMKNYKLGNRVQLLLFAKEQGWI